VECSVATASFSIIYVTYTKLYADYYRQMHCKCLKNIKISQEEKCGFRFRILNSTYTDFLYTE
jgi:hypothetical protein